MASSGTRALLTQAETDLVAASRPAALKRLTEKRLRAKVGRARTLRDKYRDLARRQRLEARGKAPRVRGRQAQGNVRTARKADVFAEVLERFQRRLASLETAAPGRASRRTPRSAPPARAAARRRDARTSRRKVAQSMRGAARRA